MRLRLTRKGPLIGHKTRIQFNGSIFRNSTHLSYWRIDTQKIITHLWFLTLSHVHIDYSFYTCVNMLN